MSLQNRKKGTKKRKKKGGRRRIRKKGLGSLLGERGGEKGIKKRKAVHERAS